MKRVFVGFVWGFCVLSERCVGRGQRYAEFGCSLFFNNFAVYYFWCNDGCILKVIS